MLLFVLALFATQEPPVPEDDIVVVGRRLQALRIVTETDRRSGDRICRVTRSSGDVALDEMVCRIAVECSRRARRVAPVEACIKPRLAAIPQLRIGGDRQVSVGRAAR